MFYGKWDVVIDEKWRLRFPAAIEAKLDNFILLKEGTSGCLQIWKAPHKIEGEDSASVFIMEVETVDFQMTNGHWYRKRRMRIPISLRGAISFYFGRRVTLVGRGEYLELWPRP